MSIERLRMGTLRVRSEPGARVKVRQLRHRMEFGTPLEGRCLGLPAEDPERVRMERHLRRWFNASVVPVKWAQLERRDGERSYRGPDLVMAFAEAHGLRVRGHCLFYAHRIHVQEWVKALPKAECLRRMEQHARETVRRYKGRIGEYDLNNELLDGDWYRAAFGPDVLRRMADWVLEEDPAVRLYVNEHDIVTGGDIDRYVALIDGLLSRGVPIGGIGVQGHIDPPFDLSHVVPVLDRLGQFGVPVKVTEFDCGIKLSREAHRGVSWIEGAVRDDAKFAEALASLPADFEERKAEALKGFYELAFGHPAVHGIYMWGFRGGHHWRTRGEITREDCSLLPAGEAYEELVLGKWWTETTVRAGDDGFAAIRAFYGRHRLECDGKGSEVELSPETERLVVEL